MLQLYMNNSNCPTLEIDERDRAERDDRVQTGTLEMVAQDDSTMQVESLKQCGKIMFAEGNNDGVCSNILGGEGKGTRCGRHYCFKR